MKIIETATFIFSFREKLSKDLNYNKLQKLLIANDWLDEEGNKKRHLYSFNSFDNGDCEIILAGEKATEDFENQIDNLFENLTDTQDVAYIKTIYNDNTEKIVLNNMDKYAKYQIKENAYINKDDKDVVVIYKKDK